MALSWRRGLTRVWAVLSALWLALITLLLLHTDDGQSVVSGVGARLLSHQQREAVLEKAGIERLPDFSAYGDKVLEPLPEGFVPIPQYARWLRATARRDETVPSGFIPLRSDDAGLVVAILDLQDGRGGFWPAVRRSAAMMFIPPVALFLCGAVLAWCIKGFRAE
jgi:hypothetical protein